MVSSALFAQPLAGFLGQAGRNGLKQDQENSGTQETRADSSPLIQTDFVTELCWLSLNRDTLYTLPVLLSRPFRPWLNAKSPGTMTGALQLVFSGFIRRQAHWPAPR